MNNEERYKKYIEEHCSNCKHRKENLCEIRICKTKDEAKCVSYEKEF